MASFLPLESDLKKQGFFLIAGIDEAGRGPLAGPVVSAAVILKENNRLPGLNDSKKLSTKQREKLFPLILEHALDYCITIVPHSTIDEVNISQATRLANDICIRSLRFQPHIVLFDGNDKQIIDCQFMTIINGDAKIRSIAAASILAKVTRDRIMTHYAKHYPQYGFEKHMGYGTRYHRSRITEMGLCDIHRKSYTFAA